MTISNLRVVTIQISTLFIFLSIFKTFFLHTVFACMVYHEKSAIIPMLASLRTRSVLCPLDSFKTFSFVFGLHLVEDDCVWVFCVCVSLQFSNGPRKSHSFSLCVVFPCNYGNSNFYTLYRSRLKLEVRNRFERRSSRLLFIILFHSKDKRNVFSFLCHISKNNTKICHKGNKHKIHI